MSSEIYAHWEVRRAERLHQQLMRELALERKRQAEALAQLSEKVGGLIRAIDAAKSEGDTPVAQTERLDNIRESKTSETVVTGASEEIEAATVKDGGAKRKLVALDLSEALLRGDVEESEAGKIHAYAKQIAARLATAMLPSDEAVRKRNDFVTYLNKLLSDPELDFDYFKSLIDSRFEALSAEIEMIAPEDITEELLEYLSLCELLGVSPAKLPKEAVKPECERLFAQLAESRKADYVYQNLMEVFAELGMTVVDEMELDGLTGQRVVDESLPDCAIFMNVDGNGVLFETVVEAENPEALSADQKARMEEDAVKVCQKHLQVIEKMHERGIELVIECSETPKAERLRKVRRDDLRRKKVVKKPKQRHMGEK